MKAGSFGVVTLLMSAIGVVIAVWSGAPARETACGVTSGWAVQLAAVRLIAGAIETGDVFMLRWAAGIGLRFASFALAWIAVEVGRLDRSIAVAFGMTLVALLLAEAIWIAVTMSGTDSKRG